MLYEDLAKKTKLPLVKALLLHIAYDSGKHSAVLQGIISSIGKPKAKIKDCEKKLGDTWRTIQDLLEERSPKRKISDDNLPSVLKKLERLESTAGEEYYMLLQLKMLQFMTKEIRELYNVDLDDIRDIFEAMTKDEERHTELLATIKKILSPPEQKKPENTPQVKYQNPDSWVRQLE